MKKEYKTIVSDAFFITLDRILAKEVEQGWRVHSFNIKPGGVSHGYLSTDTFYILLERDKE